MKNVPDFAALLCALWEGIPHSLTCNAVTCKYLVRVHGSLARDIHQKVSTEGLVVAVLTTLFGAATYLLTILIMGNN